MPPPARNRWMRQLLPTRTEWKRAAAMAARTFLGFLFGLVPALRRRRPLCLKMGKGHFKYASETAPARSRCRGPEVPTIPPIAYWCRCRHWYPFTPIAALMISRCCRASSPTALITQHPEIFWPDRPAYIGNVMLLMLTS